MLKTVMKRSTLIVFVCSLSINAFAIADSPKQINVPPGDLVLALEALAKQADVDLVYQAKRLAGLTTHGVKGRFTPQEAVVKLLEGTKLHVRIDETTGA